jgi:hypothetical protein
MSMKVQTRRWLLALGVASLLLAFLFYMDRRAPAAQFTHAARAGNALLPHGA